MGYQPNALTKGLMEIMNVPEQHSGAVKAGVPGHLSSPSLSS